MAAKTKAGKAAKSAAAKVQRLRVVVDSDKVSRQIEGAKREMLDKIEVGFEWQAQNHTEKMQKVIDAVDKVDSSVIATGDVVQQSIDATDSLRQEVMELIEQLPQSVARQHRRVRVVIEDAGGYAIAQQQFDISADQSLRLNIGVDGINANVTGER